MRNFLVALLCCVPNLTFACPDFSGRYAKHETPNYISEYIQTGCEKVRVIESDHGKVLGDYERILDGVFRQTPSGHFIKDWFEGEDLRYQMIFFDKKLGKFTEYHDQHNTVDPVNGSMVKKALIYDLNGNFLREWGIRIYRKP